MSRPISSMTGFGRGSASRRGVTVTVEARTVNGKFLSLACKVPEGWGGLEPTMRSAVEKVVARGQIELRLELSGAGTRRALRVDRAVLSRLAKELRTTALEEGLEADLSVETLVLLPGVLVEDDDSRDFAAVLETVERALKGALSDLVTMRVAEGRKLARELKRLVGRLDRVWKRARSLAPKALRAAGALLKRRLTELDEGAAGNEAVAKEVVIVAQRSDVTEELARIGSHIHQMRKALRTGGAIGRELDFIAQELFREFTTMGSKAFSPELSRLAVEAKAEVSRIREQVQNIE